KYSIKKKIFMLTMDNTTTNKVVSQLLQNRLQNRDLISIDPCLDDEELVILSSFCQLLRQFENATLALSEKILNSISNTVIVILDIKKNISYETKYSTTVEADEISEAIETVEINSISADSFLFLEEKCQISENI
ncbi:12595_t:CDS:2, partial [Cetraspora pellucida]